MYCTIKNLSSKISIYTTSVNFKRIKLPLSIGGIVQNRLCMVLHHKAHIGEIQASIWSEEMRKECEELHMPLI